MIEMFLYDDEDEAKIKFVGFVGEHGRYDLTLIYTDRHYGKTIVLNTQNNTFGIIGRDDLEEEGYISHILQLSEEEGNEVTEYLLDVVDV